MEPAPQEPKSRTIPRTRRTDPIKTCVNSVDFELSAKTIDVLANMADIIVPGHDNYLLVDSII